MSVFRKHVQYITTKVCSGPVLIISALRQESGREYNIYQNRRHNAAESDTAGGFTRCLCRLYGHWHGRACASTLCPITRSFSSHHWDDVVGLPDLELSLPVSFGLACGPFWAQADDADQSLCPGCALAG